MSKNTVEVDVLGAVGRACVPVAQAFTEPWDDLDDVVVKPEIDASVSPGPVAIVEPRPAEQDISLIEGLRRLVQQRGG